MRHECSKFPVFRLFKEIKVKRQIEKNNSVSNMKYIFTILVGPENETNYPCWKETWGSGAPDLPRPGLMSGSKISKKSRSGETAGL